MTSAENGPSIKKNFIMNAILMMSSFIFPLITFPYVSRILLAEGTGKVSFATSLVTYFVMFSQLGIPVYGIRACARVRDDKDELSRVTHELLAISLIMSVLTYIVFFICLAVIPKMRDEKTLMIITGSAIMLTSIGMEWLYQGLEQYTYITIRSLFFKVISIAAMFLLVREKDDYVIYGTISVVASSASYILNFLNARKYISIKPVGGYDLSRHMKPITVFFAISCAATVYNYLDSVMLGFMTTDADVGYFNVAGKVKNMLLSFVTSLGTVLLPRASCYIQQKKYDRFYSVCYKAINYIFVIAIPLSVFFIIFADRGVRLLSGPDFAEAVPAMKILMPTIFIIGISNILAIQMLVPMGREKTVVFAEAAGALIDFVMNLVLIPKIRSTGAAIANFAAETVVTLICWAALRNEVSEGFRNVSCWKIIVSLLAAAGGLSLIKFVPFGNFVTLIIAAILFFGIYFGTLLILKEKLTIELSGAVFERIKMIRV